MHNDADKKYPIVSGDVPRRIRGIEARRKIDRELHGIVVQQPVPQHFADWYYDLRKGKLRVYGALLRFIDVSIMQGASRTALMKIPQILMWYIGDQCDARDGLNSDSGPRRAA